MKRISLVVALIIAVVASLILLPQEVRADTKTWTGNGGDNYWSNELNWNPIGVPEPTDDITIPGNISESFIVYLDINVTLESSLEIQSYSKLSIIDSVVLDNYGSIVNTGIFGNEGILHNYGDIYNTPSGHFENNNAMDNYEQITNFRLL